MSPLLAVAILVIAALAVPALLSLRRERQRPWVEDVPSAMRPGYSDEELEGPVRLRYLTWGVVLTIGLALFLGVYMVNESRRLDSEVSGFFVSAVERGENLYTANCAQCHGAEGEGGGAASPYDPDESWPAPNLTTIAARYADNPNITDIREYIITTLERGRPGTPMPIWGSAFGGPWTDQQIEDVTDWILARQVDEIAQVQSTSLSGEELYAGNCARCHGPDGRSGEARPGPSLVGVFERHDRETIAGILRNGIYLGTGVTMPPWQNGYFYPTGPGEGEPRYDDESLERIIDHLEDLQPDELPDDAGQYRTPGVPEDETGIDDADMTTSDEADA